MKVIITSTGKKINSRFDLRFGRSLWFCLYDGSNGKTIFYENTHLEDGHGAGPRAAQLCFDLGAEKVISGDFGPKAQELLEKLGIQMVIIEDPNLTVKDIMNRIKKEK